MPHRFGTFFGTLSGTRVGTLRRSKLLKRRSLPHPRPLGRGVGKLGPVVERRKGVGQGQEKKEVNGERKEESRREGEGVRMMLGCGGLMEVAFGVGGGAGQDRAWVRVESCDGRCEGGKEESSKSRETR